MKETMRKYFPERFADCDLDSPVTKFKEMMVGYNAMRRKGRCEKMVTDVFEQSDEVRLLAGAMKKHGCNFELLRHTVCERCLNCHGGYDPDTNQIVFCENNFLTKNRIMSIMMHEMIHMFDYCRAKFDFNNLEHVACSEIRAANLTSCSIRDKLQFPGPSYLQFKGAHKYCVMDIAIRSVKAYSPETSDAEVCAIVDRVFPGCYNDLEPFGRRPREREQGAQAILQGKILLWIHVLESSGLLAKTWLV